MKLFLNRVEFYGRHGIYSSRYICFNELNQLFLNQTFIGL